jgi:hypothetical protein
MSESLPALYIKLRRGECLTHVGTEGKIRHGIFLKLNETVVEEIKTILELR